MEHSRRKFLSRAGVGALSAAAASQAIAQSGDSCAGLSPELLESLIRNGYVERGETDKAGAAIEQALDAEITPLRLQLGGDAVDAVLRELLPGLSPGDVIIDSGNSHFTDTNRRGRFLSGKNLDFMGMGISGGEAGGRRLVLKAWSLDAGRGDQLPSLRLWRRWWRR